MTTTFLGFFVNRATREEFVAPVIAADAFTAREELVTAYPVSRFELLTVYSRAELEHVLSGIDRWPGLPSKVQEPVRADLTKVTARTGGLPPLPGQVQATVQPMEQITQSAMPGWMRGLVSQPEAVAAAPVKVPAFLNQPVQKQPVAQASFQSAAKAMQPIEQAMSQPKTSLPPQSLIERLKAARGETMSAPIRREATPLPDVSAAITRNASGASVIDILKNMRK